MAETVPLGACQPSQTLVSAAKLRSVLGWLDADDPDYDPLAVLPADAVRDARPPDVDWPGGVDADYVLVDGHTRALAAHLAGADRLRVAVDDPADAPLSLYARCVGWCREAGLSTPADFVGRIVSADTHEREWIGRCHRAPEYG